MKPSVTSVGLAGEIAWVRDSGIIFVLAEGRRGKDLSQGGQGT